MKPEEIIIGCINLLMLWLFWHYGWKPYCVDQLRDELFAARDRLFLDAMAGGDGLSFKHPIYGGIRAQMNALIRFAHRISFVLAVMVNLAILLGYIRREQPTWRAALDKMPDGHAKQRLLAANQRMLFAVTKHMVQTSPTAVLCIAIFLVVAALRMLGKSSAQAAKHIRASLERRTLAACAQAATAET